MPSQKITPTHADAEEINFKAVDELENGPMEKRGCTDVLCCLFFIAFMGGMIGVAAYAITEGNPTLIGRGYDSDGYMCGVDDGYEDYPYLYFATPAEGYLTQTVCLKYCPTDYTATYPCKYNTAFPSGQSPDSCSNSDSQAVQAATIASGSGLTNEFFTYSTFSFVGRFCLPDAAYTAYESASSTVYDSGTIQQWFSDVKTTWPVIAVSLACTFVIGFIYMLILRYCSGILTWTAILCFIVGTAILGWRFYDTATSTDDDTTSTSGTSTEDTITTEKVIAYILWGVAVFAVLATLCLFNRIRLAIAIIKAASDFVKETWAVFLVPPAAIFVLVAFYIYWGITSVYLASCGDTSQIKNTPFGTFSYDEDLQRLLIYHLFGLLWFNAFVIAAVQFIIASATCLWYFAQGTGQGASGSVRKSVWRLFRYHLGSIAFGSFILAIVQLIRVILAYFQYQAKKLQGKDGKMVQYLLSCLQCYLACFERFIKFLNKNAYIQIALSGKNFCLAAKDAFFIILKNPLRFGVVSSIGGVFILVGKLFISGITTLGAYLYITESDEYSDSVYSPFIPTLMVFLFSYAIAAAFMTIYGLASDAILGCFILDEELQKKKNAPARHCPESLKVFIEKNKKKEK